MPMDAVFVIAVVLAVIFLAFFLTAIVCILYRLIIRRALFNRRRATTSGGSPATHKSNVLPSSHAKVAPVEALAYMKPQQPQPVKGDVAQAGILRRDLERGLEGLIAARKSKTSPRSQTTESSVTSLTFPTAQSDQPFGDNSTTKTVTNARRVASYSSDGTQNTRIFTVERTSENIFAAESIVPPSVSTDQVESTTTNWNPANKFVRTDENAKNFVLKRQNSLPEHRNGRDDHDELSVKVEPVKRPPTEDIDRFEIDNLQCFERFEAQILEAAAADAPIATAEEITTPKSALKIGYITTVEIDSVDTDGAEHGIRKE